jgi:hypothetical protein
MPDEDPDGAPDEEPDEEPEAVPEDDPEADPEEPEDEVDDVDEDPEPPEGPPPEDDPDPLDEPDEEVEDVVVPGKPEELAAAPPDEPSFEPSPDDSPHAATQPAPRHAATKGTSTFLARSTRASFSLTPWVGTMQPPSLYECAAGNRNGSRNLMRVFRARQPSSARAVTDGRFTCMGGVRAPRGAQKVSRGLRHVCGGPPSWVGRRPLDLGCVWGR